MGGYEMAKVAKRKSSKGRASKKKAVRKPPARKKVAKKKPARRKVARKKPARKKAATAYPASSVYEFNDEFSWNIKKALDKYLKLVTRHTGYYKDVKRWTDITIDKIVQLGYELDAAHREYLRMAGRYLKKLKRF
jgi:hypothetical protein